MISPQSIMAYLLAGGESSRFGSDKARAIVHGQPLIRRVADQVLSVIPAARAVARSAGAYDDLGIPTIADLRPGCGPLSGLHAALHDARTPWVLLVSCDFVVCRPEWIHRLLRADGRSDAAVAFRHTRWEPLLALYPRSILPAVEAHLDAGKLAMQQLLDMTGATALPMPEDWPAVAHVNTRDELNAAIAGEDAKP